MLRLFVCCIAALTATTHRSFAEPLDDVTLVKRVLGHAVNEAEAAAQAGAAQAAQAVAPATPTPRLALRREESFGANTEFSTTAVGLEADFDLSGRVDLARAAGAATAEALGHELETTRMTRVCAARALALEARAAEARAAVRAKAQAELIALIEEIDALVKARQRAGFDAERARQRAALHARAVQADTAAAAHQTAALAAWVGDFEGIAVDPAPVDADWVEQTLPRHPRLAALSARERAATRVTESGERWWVPGVGLSAGWRIDAPPVGDIGHGYEAGLTVDLPLIDKGAPERSAGEAARLAAAGAAATLRAEIEARAGGLLAELTSLVPPPPEDDFAERARQRYRQGVGQLSELFDALESAEAMALARVEHQARVRALRLDLACTVGTFPEAPLMELIR